MPYSRPTLQTIIDRMEADAESRLQGSGAVALLRRSVVRILVRVFGAAVHIVYGYLEHLMEQRFVHLAERTWLDWHGRQWRVTRKAASYAIGGLTFTGTNGTVIPSGTLVTCTDTGVEFETTADGTVSGGVAAVSARAHEAGTDGNTSAGSPPDVELVQPIAGITGVTVTTAFGGGVDQESDDDYKARILARVQNGPRVGTAADFKAWAEEFTGVTRAWCFPAMPGPGQVTVLYTGAALWNDVRDHIAALMQVTTDLIVSKPTEVEMDFAITIDPNTTAQQAAITASLTTLFAEVAAPGSNLYISQLHDAIYSAGVTNYDITAISRDGTPVVDVNADLVYTGYEYPVLGTITYGGF